MERPEPGACAQGRSLLPEDAQPRSSRSLQLKVPAQAYYGTFKPPPPILHINEFKTISNENMSIVCKSYRYLS